MNAKKKYLPPSILGRKKLETQNQPELKERLKEAELKPIKGNQNSVQSHLELTNIQGDMDPAPDNESIEVPKEVPLIRKSNIRLPSNVLRSVTSPWNEPVNDILQRDR